jgi:hypothetical protein
MMNINKLKIFARAARTKLMSLVGGKLDWVLTHRDDDAGLLGKRKEIEALHKRLAEVGREQLIDEVAYTWFNRLMALRFMDANDYTTPRVVTPADGMTLPAILQEAKGGHIDENYRVDRDRINSLLDGRTPAINNNPDQEVYRMLLVSACNYWHGAMPFMFKTISDYTELLLPDDLLSATSIVSDIREGMSVEDCQQEELIGWLYQFYISQVNEELIQSKKKYKRNELAPASQLFTPHWIVRYMVDNTLGQLWAEMYPDSKLVDSLEFYIKPKTEIRREIKPLECIKFYDPCVGSAHILSYAYEVFYKMYEELGYSNSDISKLIIENNLWGTDIDPRAAQLSSFVLLMKGRRSYRRLFNKDVKTNISYYKDFSDDEKFSQAASLGSLITVSQDELAEKKSGGAEVSLFNQSHEKEHLDRLYQILGQRYDLVVTNPPYIPSSRMDDGTKRFVETNYPATKSDLFATFIIRCLELCNEDGFTGYMTPFVWMFISSYEALRREIIDNHFIHNLIQLEYSGFDGATVPICTFTLRNNKVDAKGCYIRLSDFKGSANQAPKTLEAIGNRSCGWFYEASQSDFEKIPGSPIGYWVSGKMIILFENNKSLSTAGDAKQGLATADNNRFLRLWFEINTDKIGFGFKNMTIASQSNFKWFPHNKGGEKRKWYGNQEYVVNWENNGYEIKNFRDSNGKIKSRPQNLEYSFKSCISWSDVTSGMNSFRYYPEGFTLNVTGLCYYTTDYEALLSVLNNKVFNVFTKLINPTIHFTTGDLLNLPYAPLIELRSKEITRLNLMISKIDWDAHETSWNFEENELIRILKACGTEPVSLEFLYNDYTTTWEEYFRQLHANEEELNRQFIEIYGLQDELTPDVPLSEITILQQGEIKITPDIEIEFQPSVVLKQFISYAVGCMMGRYSIDVTGLILANQGETLEEYLQRVPTPSFSPDEDAIIPVLEGEYFTDDIVERLRIFLRTAFGTEKFDENMRFIVQHIGDLRKYLYKDFYADHIKMYKKRPIYWMFASPKKSFQALVYMHRMRSDTPSKVFSDYLQPYIHKLQEEREDLNQKRLRDDYSPRERTAATKQIEQITKQLVDCEQYAKTLLAFASTRPTMDLDDGVRVNYTRFKDVLIPIKGLEKEE